MEIAAQAGRQAGRQAGTGLSLSLSPPARERHAGRPRLGQVWESARRFNHRESRPSLDHCYTASLSLSARLSSLPTRMHAAQLGRDFVLAANSRESECRHGALQLRNFSLALPQPPVFMKIPVRSGSEVFD